MRPKTENLLSNALKFTFSTSLFLALNGGFLFVFASFLYDTPISFTLMAASFLITFSVYSLNMATDSKEDAINRSAIASKKKIYYIVPSVACMIASLIIGILDGPYTLLILSTPLIIGIFYSLKLSKSLPRLKEVVGVKSILVAFSWGITGTFLPVTIAPIETYKALLVFVYLFARMLVNTIVFDALDVRGDRASGILTVPLALGISKTKKLLFLINSGLVVWLVYCTVNGVFLHYILTLAIGVVYDSAIIWYFLRQTRPRLYAEIFVDGEWLPLMMLMKVLLIR
jgi:4-hydroxybenzoate polyprenyltransferase